MPERVILEPSSSTESIFQITIFYIFISIFVEMAFYYLNGFQHVIFDLILKSMETCIYFLSIVYKEIFQYYFFVDIMDFGPSQMIG